MSIVEYSVYDELWLTGLWVDEETIHSKHGVCQSGVLSTVLVCGIDRDY